MKRTVPKVATTTSGLSQSSGLKKRAIRDTSKLFAVAVEEDDNLLPPMFFLASAASLAKLFFVLQDSLPYSFSS